MAKAPQAGRSKTRLCPPLSPDQAAQMSAAFLRDTFDNIAMAAGSAPVTAYAAYAPAGMDAAVRQHAGMAARLVLADGRTPVPEGVEGFGRCLLQAMQAMLADGHAAACVLSSDCPTLPTELLIAAAQILLAPGERAVLGPADDGGYYLLGLKAAHAHMFRDIAWSTGQVAEQTRKRAAEIGLELIELDCWFDVDDAASLERLVHAPGGYPAPHTAAVLGWLGLQGVPAIAARHGQLA